MVHFYKFFHFLLLSLPDIVWLIDICYFFKTLNTTCQNEADGSDSYEHHSFPKLEIYGP